MKRTTICKNVLWMLVVALYAGQVSVPAAERGGAEAYYQWLSACLDAVENDLPAITTSAEAAAAKYVKEDYELGICGDEGVVGETCGRSGGLMRLRNVSPGAALKPDNRDLKCVVLLVLREHNLDSTLGYAKELNQHGNKVLIGIGRRELLDKTKAAGVVLAAAADIHAAPHGGLFPSPPRGEGGALAPDEGGTWQVPTDPVASMVVAWTWIGEFASACTRLGKMPPLYLGFAVPGGVERAKKIGNIKFHAGEPKSVAAGSVGKEYLAKQRKNLAALHKDEMGKVRQVSELVDAARRAGNAVYCVVHGHAVLGHVPYPPDDPGFFKRANRGWFDVDKDLRLSAGDVIFCVGFDTVFQGQEWGNFAENARKAGAKLAWSLATYRADDIKTIPADEILIAQHWDFGDAVAAIGAYDVKILPTSGVQAEAVYWMVNAEMFRLSKRK